MIVRPKRLFMKKTSNLQQFFPLDSTSEIILVWEREGFPQNDWTAFSFQGKCDAAALEEALQNKLHLWPAFHSHLVVQTRGFFQTCSWQPVEEISPLEVIDLQHLEAKPADMEHWIQQRMAPHIHRYRQDLAKDVPVKFFLFLLPEQSGFFTIVWHHAATDGGGLYNFLRDLFAEYHRLVTGFSPVWTQVAGIHAQAGQTEEVPPPRYTRFLAEAIPQMMQYGFMKPARIISSPDPMPGRNMIRYIFDDPALQRALRERARREEGTVSDLCLAAAKLVLQDWNEERGKPPGIMHHWMAVNQRLRQSLNRTSIQSNPLIAINIPSLPANRKDPQTLLGHVIAYRKMILRDGLDMSIQQITGRLMKAGRILPIPVRYPLLRLLMDHPMSFFLSNIGVVWPKIVNGRPTGETAIRTVGSMEILDVHSSIGATYNNPMALFLRTFQGRLSFVFSVNRHRISDEDAKAFSKRIVHRVMNYL
jgi:hypothetical protein